MLLHESNIFPVLYFPKDDISMKLLTTGNRSTHCPFKGDASYWTISAGDAVVENAAWSYEARTTAPRNDIPTRHDDVLAVRASLFI